MENDTTQQHTPGPWKVSNYRPFKIIARDPMESTFEIGDDKFPVLGECFISSDFSYQTTKANAELIASAPSLAAEIAALKAQNDALRYRLRELCFHAELLTAPKFEDRAEKNRRVVRVACEIGESREALARCDGGSK
jgi:hypothetical protein